VRCSCCDVRLTNSESILKHTIYGHYLDTCFKCLKSLEIPHTTKMVEETGIEIDSLWDEGGFSDSKIDEDA
jgi:hypothetical protein